MVFATVLLAPSFALASWWNPFSWFNSWTFSHTQEEVKMTEVQKNEAPAQEATTSETVPVAHEQTASTSVQKAQTKKEAVPARATAISPEVSVAPVPAQDVCANIEGVQTVVPAGYSVTNGICTIIYSASTQDLCPNIEGVQDVFPEDIVLNKATGECVTKEEMTAITKAKRTCEDAKQKTIDIAKKREKVITDYNESVQGIQSEHVSAGVMNGRIAKLYEEDNRILDGLNAELVTANTQVQMYCY